MRILVAEEDGATARQIQQTLEQAGHEVRALTEPSAAWRASHDEDSVDALLLSATLPGVDTLEWVRRLRQRAKARHTYVLLLRAKGQGPEGVALAIRSGADDVLWKPFDADELNGRMVMAHRAIRLHTTLASLQDALRVQAMNDPLTALWNHGAILDMALREVSRAQREKSPTCFVLLDVDGFSGVNETFGHEAGDVVLREAARRVRAAVRSYDGVGRYGGDILLVVLPRCEERDAANLAERVRVQLSEAPVNTGLARVPITVSIGIAARGPDDPREISDLLRSVERALQRAKDLGRNRVELESSELSRPVG